MKPKVYSVSDHDISPSLIDRDALSVVNKLREAGHIAYLVGGSVRDLLLKRTPKDFDVSTSALPEEIKQLFQRQCLLIGRRFRLAHIRFGHKVIEVSTFRSGENEDDLIVRDNQWGSPEEDVLRRDFTINGLFYDPLTHSIIDYVGGWEDIHKNTLKTIGVPDVRFKQDPVRMIRLLKFRARFGFEIDSEAKRALIACRKEILKSASARVLEEMLRMMESGASAAFFRLLLESGMLALIYPALVRFLKSPDGEEGFRYLASIDQVNNSLGKATLDRSVLMAGLLFPIFQQELRSKQKETGQPLHIGDVMISASSLVNHFEQDSFVRCPKRLVAIMNSILAMQYRLTPMSGKAHHHPRIFRQKDFESALMLLKIRAIVDKDLIETYTQWKSFYRDQQHPGERKHSTNKNKRR
ncbi:MAG: polynucleotide adenylyltransferase PcnB [Parachlamydiaceae bacterium]|nr:polynucleotide adenylyltransferase PcnB [Parachlamydiaceae bacterium]